MNNKTKRELEAEFLPSFDANTLHCLLNNRFEARRAQLEGECRRTMRTVVELRTNWTGFSRRKGNRRDDKKKSPEKKNGDAKKNKKKVPERHSYFLPCGVQSPQVTY